MYFKEIEMTGFKSFADRTVVRLEQGMTCVVGPNGCGKSNILDALRWALGEQRAKVLRGAHMQDVIFNGSEERAPTGMAEVTLTFDNADNVLPLDFAEVQITRRIYRSGESEYLINKAPCRLRDIQELFMDTGIGTNAYSMIGQGDIGMVLSSKPEDRRYLFEEAAGIIKYKSRKRVAMRKLDQAEHNLLRLHDIVQEVQRQLRSLKRQVNAAIRYRELHEQLRDLEVRAAWFEHQMLSTRAERLRGEFTQAQDSYEKESAELTGLEAEFEQLSLKKLEADRVLHARREGVHTIESEMEKIDRQIALIRQQIEFNYQQEIRATKERSGFGDRAAEMETLRDEAAAKLDSLAAKIEGAQATLDTKQAELNEAAQAVDEADRHVEAVRSQSDETRDNRARTQTTLETVGVSIANIDTQLRALREREEADAARQETLQSELEGHNAAEAEKRGALSGLRDEGKALAEQLAELGKQIAALADEHQRLSGLKTGVEARLESLRKLRDSYEGFTAGVQAIMSACKEHDALARGVLGPVGDLVSTEEKYETAIEAALGGRINNIVVYNTDAAKSAVSYLKEHHAGRVTFLPLDTIRTGKRDDFDELRGMEGVLGRALEFVDFEAHLRPAMTYVLYNTVFVETIDHALAISQSDKGYPRMVTLDGEVVESSGAVTGGSAPRNTSGMLGRSAEITMLETKVEDLAAEVARAAEERGAAKAEEERLNAAASTRAESESLLEEALRTLSVDVARASAELDSLVQAAQTLKEERGGLSGRRESLEAERREAASQAEAMEGRETELKEELLARQDDAARARQTQAQLADDVSNQRVEMARLHQSRQEAERERHRHHEEYESSVAQGKERVELVEDLKANQLGLEHDTKDQIEGSKALAESKEEARKKVVEAENERQGLLDASDKIESGLKGVRDLAREAQSVVHRIELELRHDEDQIGFFNERMQTEYNVSLAQLSEEEVGTDDHDDETRERLVEEIRTKLERMGTVNLMAIEEFDVLTERNDFLVGQETDLCSAREALLGVVARIDETIKDMFLDTFNAVADQFRHYFRRLFNGGQARIYLLDEDDPLESGIEIEARPPGKKPQTLSLLSGGEQAMTAIALLFSIFKAKPSPFCVLDEVDAPLDDANIGRFIDLVQEFATDTQFIVITHNKQTMASAGALYGVTQQERGVSQMVSVKFDEVPDVDQPAA